MRLALRRRIAQRKAAKDQPNEGAGAEEQTSVAAGDEKPAAAGSDARHGLPEQAKAQLEAKLGADLSSVTVHVGPEADRLAKEIGARAFTQGKDIFFAEGEYAPDSPEGLELLAHELTHVVQQGAAPKKFSDAKDSPKEETPQDAPEDAGPADTTQAKGYLSEPSDPAEREADTIAAHVVHGGAAQPAASADTRVHRAVAPAGEQQEAGGQKPAGGAADAQMADAAAAAGATAQASAAAQSDQEGVAPPAVEGDGKADGPLSEDKALSVLNDAFKGYKAMAKGSVQVLDQAAFQAAYDKVYGKTEYSWDKYVKPKWGNLNGFAHENVNYINKNMANTGTVPHEMLHNNVAADWRDVVGNQFDEGATDYLKQHALKKAGLSSPNSYEDQMGVVKAFLATGVSEDQLFTAYLKGGAATIVAKWVDEHCAGKWSEVKAACQSQDYAKAKVKLALKSGGDEKKSEADLGNGGSGGPEATGGTANV